MDIIKQSIEMQSLQRLKSDQFDLLHISIAVVLGEWYVMLLGTSLNAKGNTKNMLCCLDTFIDVPDNITHQFDQYD